MGYDMLFEPAKALEDAAKAADLDGARTVIAQLHRLEQQIQRGAALGAPLEESTP